MQVKALSMNSIERKLLSTGSAPSTTKRSPLPWFVGGCRPVIPLVELELPWVRPSCQRDRCMDKSGMDKSGMKKSGMKDKVTRTTKEIETQLLVRKGCHG